MSFTRQYLAETIATIQALSIDRIDLIAQLLADIKARYGRVFVLGVGGSAANAAHAVNDLRKIAGIEAYAPTDNVAELTARTNDEGWRSTFVEYLRGSHVGRADAVLVLSVGGGSATTSANIVDALSYAATCGATLLGIVGRDGGYTARLTDCCVIVPVVNEDRVTPHQEALQAVLWHLLVNHPALAQPIVQTAAEPSGLMMSLGE